MINVMGSGLQKCCSWSVICDCSMSWSFSSTACADPDGGGTGGPDPLKNHKNIGFLSNTSPDPLRNHKAIYQASIQCCYLNGVSLAGR